MRFHSARHGVVTPIAAVTSPREENWPPELLVTPYTPLIFPVLQCPRCILTSQRCWFLGGFMFFVRRRPM